MIFKLAAKIGKSILDFCPFEKGYSYSNEDFSEVMQKALDSGEEILYLQNGVYKINKPLFIHSNTTLVLDEKARLIAADNSMKTRGDFLLSNSSKEEGDNNIKIYGGIWDGNNRFNPKGNLYDQNGYSGSLLCFMNVENLVLSGLKLHNPAAYFTRFCKMKSFLIENIEFSTDNPVSNNDGIHLGGLCEDGVIKNLRAVSKGSTTDDMIAINADDAVNRVENLDMVCGDIKNIHIENIYAEDCHTFIRMLSIDSKISNIYIDNVSGGCRHYFVNMDAGRYCMTPIIKKDDLRYLQGAGCIENVTINNINIENTNPDNYVLIILESNMNNFEIANFKRKQNSREEKCSTLKLSKIGKSFIELYGIQPEQLKQIKQNSKVSFLSHANLMDKRLGVNIQTSVYDYLVIPYEGFDFLKIKSR